MEPADRTVAEGILFTDQYQLTMAQLYHRMGLHEKQAQFDHFFRSYPDYGMHQAGYCIMAGLEWLLMNPHTYHVSLTERLWDLKQELIQSARRTNTSRTAI